jgi:glycosyltransferase involved in cell wall biosynthesis
LKVLLRAPLLTTSGYGVHSRQIFEWLSELNNIDLHVECLNWGMTPWILNDNYEDGLIKKIMECSKKLEPPYDITFQLQLPDEWNPELGKINIGMSAVVETDRCNPKWIDACNRMSHVIVPSNFTKSVLKRSGILTTPVSVIPEWFDKNIEAENFKEIDLGNIDTDFNFLVISQLNSNNALDDRKNIFNTIKWICEEFNGDQSVGVFLKTNSGKGTTIDKKITKNIMQQMVKAFGKKEFPRIYLIHGNMEKEEVASLYAHDKINCFVSATRGEGYGLPIVDAAASGMPVIATNWSGHLDFLGDNFSKVDYQLKEIRKEKVDNRIFFEGFRWAEPVEKDFKQKIRNVFENYEKHKIEAQTLKEKTSNNFSKAVILKQYNKFLEKILCKE